MYAVKLRFEGLGIPMFPRFMFGDNLMGTTGAISFYVGTTLNVKVQTSWRTSYIIKFMAGQLISGDFEGVVCVDRMRAMNPLRIDWKNTDGSIVDGRPPYIIRQTILGF